MIAVTECRTAEEVRALARLVAARHRRMFDPQPVQVAPEPGPDPVPETPPPPAPEPDLDPEEQAPPPPSPITVREIVHAVAEAYGIPFTAILSPRRTLACVIPRQEAMWVARTLCPQHSLPRLGRYFGGRDHTTVLHAIRKIERLYTDDPQARARMDLLLELVLQKFGRA